MSDKDETLDLAGEVNTVDPKDISDGDPLVTALVKINVTDTVLAALRAEAEADRLAREEQERKDREAAISAEESRQAKVREEQEAAAVKLKADQEAFERKQQEAKDAAEAEARRVKEEADRVERERLAKVAEDERKAREAAEAETRRLQSIADAKAKEEADAKAIEAERARLAALAPDKEKVKNWVWNIEAEIDDTLPVVGHKELSEAMASTKAQILDLLHALNALANGAR